MAETRHRTVLEIGVDDRQVRGLGASMNQAFSANAVDAFERSMARASRTLDRLIQQQTRLVQMGGGAPPGGRPGAPGGGPGGGPGAPPGAPGAPGAAPRPGQAPGFWNRAGAVAIGAAVGTAAAGARGTGAVSQAVSAVPIAGPVLAGGIQAIQSFYQANIQRATGRMGAFGATGLGRAEFRRAEQQGMRAGMMPGQTQGMMAQFAAQTGLTGQELLTAATGEAIPGAKFKLSPASLMGQQRTMGFGNLGGVVGGAGAAGGAENPLDMMRDAVSTGVQSGFREGRLDRFFAQFGSWIEQIRTSGIMLNAASGMQLVRGMAGLGPSFTGEAGMRAAQTVQQAMGGLGRGRGTGQMMLLHGAGMAGGRHGNRTFMQARVFAAKAPAEVMQNFLSDMRQMSGGRNVTSDQLATAMEPLFEEAGMQFSPQQLMEMAARVTKGGDLSDFTTAADRTGAREMEDRRLEQLGRVVGTPRAEARFAIRRANLGAQENVSKAARALRNFELALGETLVPAIAAVTSRILRSASQIARGDFVGAASTITSDIGEAIGPRLREITHPEEVEEESLRRGLRPGDEERSRVLREMEERGVPGHLRRGALERMERGQTTPAEEQEVMSIFGRDPSALLRSAGEALIRVAEVITIPTEGDLAARPA